MVFIITNPYAKEMLDSNYNQIDFINDTHSIYEQYKNENMKIHEIYPDYS